MSSDAEGFLAPQIDKDHCTGCLQCRTQCPALQAQPQRNAPPDVYACWSLDDAIRMQSSSGGLFSVLAEDILLRGGVVFGALFDETLHVRHDFTETREKLPRFRSSKYVQSEIGDSYRNVRSFLDRGREVLFTGTPCQIAGLYACPGDLRHHPGLTTCDIVCHGVPSPQVFASYVRWLQDKYQRPITGMNMRDKSRSWRPELLLRIVSPEHSDLLFPSSRDPFFVGFLKNMFLRPSCHQCRFAREDRPGDWTLADFWGIGNTVPFAHDTQQGVSLLLVNNDKGRRVFASLKDRLFYERRSLDEAKQGNSMLSRATRPHPNREQFFRDYRQLPFDAVVRNHLRPGRRLMKRVKTLLKTILGARIVSAVRRFRRSRVS